MSLNQPGDVATLASVVDDLGAAAAMEDEQLSDEDFEEDEDGEEGDEGVIADIRGLVKGKGNDEKPPPKKRRKT